MANPASPVTRSGEGAIRLHFALYTSSQGNYFFNEIRDLIAGGLKELGITVETRNETNGFAPRADWHLVIAPHEFFELGNGRNMAAGYWPANVILFNTEQPSSHWLTLSVKHFERAATIWDIDFDSALRIGKRGYPCDYLPLGHVASSALFQEVDRLPLIEETRHLPDAVRDLNGFKGLNQARPIDLLFLGHGSPRRERYFARQSARLGKFNCFFHKPAAVRPLIPGQTTNMNTVISVGLSQRSKILLNIHHGVDRYFEWHRIALLGIAQRTLVATEPCSVAPPFQANLDYVEAPLDELPARIEYYLQSPSGQAEARKIIDHGYETLTKRCRLSERLRPLIEQLSQPTEQRLATAARYFPVISLQPDKAPGRALCVVTPAVAGEGLHADAGSSQVALAELLAQAGHQITLLHTEAAYGEGLTASYWRKYFSERGIDYVMLPASRQIPLEATEPCGRAYETYLWLKERPFAAVHFPETFGIGFYCLLAKRQGTAFAHTRFCMHVHSPRPWRRAVNQQFISQPGELELDFLEQECLRQAEAMTTTTRFMRQWLEQQQWPLPPERQLLPDTIIPPKNLPSGPVTKIEEVVYLGPLSESPGLAIFCDAVERIKDQWPKGISIVFIDDSTTVPSPRASAYLTERTRHWKHSWRTKGAAPADAPIAFRSEAQLVVLPLPGQNSALNLRRCLAQGVPILVAGRSGGNELIHSDDHSHALFEPTPVALATAIEKAMRDGTKPSRPAAQLEHIQEWLRWHEDWLKPAPAAVPANPAPQPLVSVCVTHFNRPLLLAQALASLRAQDYPNFEVVLVDDGSTDRAALAMLTALEPEFKQRGWQIVRQNNRYLGAARNNAARHARGEFLIFMDDDNFAKPHEISAFIKAAHATGADIVTSAMDLFTGTEAPKANQKPKARWVFLGGSAATGAFRNCFGDANACIRRESFLRVGGFTEDYGITHEDWEFHARALFKGCRLETTPEALFYYRVAEQSMIRSTPRYANHQRSLRPYLEAVPQPLLGLMHLLQGSVLFPPEKYTPPPDLENVIRSNRRLVAIAKELIPAGQVAAAEAIFLEILNSASITQLPGVVLQTLLDIGSALVEKNCGQMAQGVLSRAEQIAIARNDDFALKEARDLLAAIRKTGAEKKSPSAAPAPPPLDLPRENQANERPQLPPQSVPRVSVVIPVFNNLALTRGCLESIAATNNDGVLEIIVVDNASNDGTPEFLNGEQIAGRMRWVRNEKNLGFAHACNQGAAAAKSSLVVFLNNDTKVTAGWATAMAQAALLPDVGVVGAKLLYPDGRIQHAGIEFINGVPDHPHRHAEPNSPAVSRYRELDMVTGACFMIHRDLCLKLGGFDESFQNGVEDIDLCARVRAAGRKVVYEPKAVVYHLEGQSAGRFNHVNENLKLFFQRWQGWFDGSYRFIVPQPPKIILAARSLLLTTPVTTNKPGAEATVVDWIGSFLDHGSLSHVNRELTAALKENPQLRVHCIATASPATRGFEAQAQQLQGSTSADAAVTVRHAWPPDWRRPTRGKLAVIQPWEFGVLPQEWVRQAGNVDEFWVPSEFVRESYLASGVPAHKVFVVPNGINPGSFHPQVEPMQLSTKKTFKFLFVGGTIGRKGPDLLLKAYLASFTAADDVCLVIKDFGGNTVYAGQTFEKQIRAAQALPNAPEIVYLNEEMAPALLPGLYKACHCLVLPYRGEGFGLPVLEAMACGLPAIVTAGGATDDFVQDAFAWRIPAARNFIGEEVGGMKLCGKGWLLEPDPSLIGQQMRLAFSDPAETQRRGEAASRHAHKHFSWHHSAAVVAERITALTAENPAAKPSPGAKVPPANPPPVALAGQLHEARKIFGHKKLPEAWAATVAAIQQRPFHPEAFLLLAEIALAAGNATAARECAEKARALAPAWNPAKQFLKKPLRGSLKPDWLKIPEKNPHALSICLIVKNEERFLAQCLRSVRDLAAQIVIVDTGSTDRTREIAQEHGANVINFAWCQDFSAARNAALQAATGDWVLVLDADEELPASQHARLRTDLAQAKALAFRLPLVNRELEGQGQSFVPRLFRNAPGVYYTGRIHEQVFPSLMPYCKSWGLELSFGTAELLHHGYTSQMMQDRNKIRRNLELLRLAVKENPSDANLMMNLGLELVRLGDLADGIEKYREAFRLMSAASEETTAPELREVLLTQFTSQLYKIRAHDEIVQVLGSPLARRGGLTASLHFALGLALFELKQFSRAAEQMRHCIARRRQPAISPINTDILTAAPGHCLALSLARAGDASAADKAFLEALAAPGGLPGSSETIKLDYAKFLAGQHRTVEAFHKLHEVVTANPRQVAAWQTGGELALGHPDFLEFATNWTAEASRLILEDFTISRQRAELLLFLGDTAAAATIWERLWNSERQPMILAALILCETLEGQSRHLPDQIVEEGATSRAFIKWYQRLIAMRAHAMIQKVNARLDEFTPKLPTATAMLQKALSESLPTPP